MNLKESTFTGSNWGMIWRSMLLTLGMAFSLFIATPWLYAWYCDWYYGNMIVDGKGLKFIAKGRDCFFMYIIILVTIVTFGIGSIFMQAWLQRRTMEYVHFRN